MRYHSTRNQTKTVTASQAILYGLAEDGGLFVPETMPVLAEDPAAWIGKSYQEIAYEVMKLFLTDFTEEELKSCIKKAYDQKFEEGKIAPLHEADGIWFLELFHGSTLAFKDIALSILPHLMTVAAKKNQQKEEIVILTATSGDTGKAALEGFADVEGTKIVVFYPKNGVSPIQERQMVTQKGANTCVVGIQGSFDDAQRGVKTLLENGMLRKKMQEAGCRFSTANSINVGRLIPQVVYYVYAYVQLLKNGALAPGEKMRVVVPTGNFGNLLAAYYAKQLGVPICKLFCASNDNKVLYDFFQTGVYDRNRPLLLTASPSMDILVSSNLERLLYHMTGDTAAVSAWMKQLAECGRYEIPEELHKRLLEFGSGYADEKQVKSMVSSMYEKTGYLIDPHTAVAAHICEEQGREGVTLVAATASPFKFAGRVVGWLFDPDNKEEKDEFVLAERLSEQSGLPLPDALEQLRYAPVLHNTVCTPEEMQAVIERFCNKVSACAAGETVQK